MAEMPARPEPIVVLIERYRAIMKYFNDHASALSDPVVHRLG